MIDQERKADYEKSAHESWRWQFAAENLFESANYLLKIHERAMRRIAKKGQGTPPRGYFADQQAHYLEGKCIELYLKCLLIKSGERVISEKGRMARELQTHKLIRLCGKLGFVVSDSERGTLDKLTDAIEFWGTYPIPTKAEKWRPKIGGIEGLQPIYWWSPADTSNYTNVVQRLRERAGPVDW